MRRSRRWLLFPALLVAASVAFPAFPQDKVLLRLKHKPGDRYVATLTSHQTIHQELRDRTDDIEQTLRFEFGLEVLSVDEAGTAELKTTWRRIAIEHASAAAKFNYDSAVPSRSEDHAAVAFYRQLVGESVTMRVTDRGEIQSVTGLEAIREKVMRKFPEKTPAWAAAKGQVEAAINERRLIELMSRVIFFCPENPVGPGDRWSRPSTLILGTAALVAQEEYEVKRVGEEKVDVNVRTTFAPAPQNPDSEPAAAVTVSKGEERGTVKVARADAMVAQSDLFENLSLGIEVQKQKVQQTIEAKTSAEVKAQ
jgi:hypothetical protein